MVSFPEVFPPKSCMHLSSPPCLPHALLVSFFLISSVDYHLVSYSDHESPHYAVSSSPCWVQIFSSAPYSQIPSAYVPQCDRPSFTPLYNRWKILVLNILVVVFLISEWKGEDFGPNGIRYFLSSICSSFLQECIFDLFEISLTIWNFPHFQGIY